jgi:hypothetical protein
MLLSVAWLEHTPSGGAECEEIPIHYAANLESGIVSGRFRNESAHPAVIRKFPPLFPDPGALAQEGATSG